MGQTPILFLLEADTKLTAQTFIKTSGSGDPFANLAVTH
jgi:hypothetical protein